MVTIPISLIYLFRTWVSTPNPPLFHHHPTFTLPLPLPRDHIAHHRSVGKA